MINANGVSNAASLQPGFTPASWIAVQGTNLAQTTRTWHISDFVGNLLPTQLDGVSVWVNGKPGYIYYVSPTLVNLLAPDDTATGPVQVQVANSQGTSVMSAANETQFTPAFFQFSPKYPAAAHLSGVLLGPPGLIPGANFAPAKPGETIELYGTGFGPTNPALPANQTVTKAAPLVNSVTVTVGGEPAKVRFAGLVFPGEELLNVTLPADLPDGDATLVATVGDVSTQTGIFILVQH